MYDKTKFIYVGIDLHKEQHTAVIMDCFNEKLGEITLQNKPSEFGKLVTKSKKYCTDPGKETISHPSRETGDCKERFTSLQFK